VNFDLKTVSIWIVALAMAGGAAFLPAIYNIGLAVAPAPPVPAQIHAPPLIRAAVWANANGNGEPSLRPLTPWSFFGLMTCNLVADVTNDGKPPQMGDKQEECFDRQSGLLIAGQLSREHVNQSGIPASPRWALSQTATTANLTRNWDIDSVIDTLAATGYYGHGWRGVYAASEGFFGKPAGELSAAEAATIAMQVPYPRMTDPWTRMDAAVKRRNELLKRMHRSGAVDDHTFEAALLAPITVKPPPATWDSPRIP
jgi:hypothetical protein